MWNPSLILILTFLQNSQLTPQCQRKMTSDCPDPTLGVVFMFELFHTFLQFVAWSCFKFYIHLLACRIIVGMICWHIKSLDTSAFVCVHNFAKESKLRNTASYVRCYRWREVENVGPTSRSLFFLLANQGAE